MKRFLTGMSTSSSRKEEEIGERAQEGWKSTLSAWVCLQLLVLFHSIGGLGFHKREHFINLSDQCVHTHFP